MFELEDCIAFLTGKVAKKLADEHERQLAPAGITRVQWMALHHIHGHSDVTQRELAALLGTREATIARLLDRMEKDCLVVRVQKDRRTNTLQITEKGEQAYQHGTAITEQFRDDALRDISAQDVAAFRRVLAKLEENTATGGN